MYSFIKKIKNVFVPLQATKLEEVSIRPGDQVLVLKDGKPFIKIWTNPNLNVFILEGR